MIAFRVSVASPVRRLRVAVAGTPVRLRVDVAASLVRLRVAVSDGVRLRVSVTAAEVRLRVGVQTDASRLRVSVDSPLIRLRVQAASGPILLRVEVAPDLTPLDLLYYQHAGWRVILNLPDLLTADAAEYLIQVFDLQENLIIPASSVGELTATWEFISPGDGIYRVLILTEDNEQVVDTYIPLDARFIERLSVLRDKAINGVKCRTPYLLEVLDGLHVGALDNYRLARYADADEILRWVSDNYPVGTL